MILIIVTAQKLLKTASSIHSYISVIFSSASLRSWIAEGGIPTPSPGPTTVRPRPETSFQMARTVDHIANRPSQSGNRLTLQISEIGSDEGKPKNGKENPNDTNNNPTSKEIETENVTRAVHWHGPKYQQGNG